MERKRETVRIIMYDQTFCQLNAHLQGVAQLMKLEK